MTGRKTKSSRGPAVSAKNFIIDNGAELQASLLAGIAKTSIHVMYSAGNGGFRKTSAERINRELAHALNGASVK